MTGSQHTRPAFPGIAGAVNIACAEILKSDAAARQAIATLPAGAVILQAWVEVLEAFNAGVSNLVTVGWGAIAAGTANDIVPTVDETTPGVYAASAPIAALAAETDVYVYYTPGATGATTGKARAYVVWARTADNG